MIQIILKALFVGWADRFRGQGGFFTIDGVTYNTARIITLLLMGWGVASFTGHYLDRVALDIAVLVGLGMSFGWGMPLGAAITGQNLTEYKLRNPTYQWEWWQFGVLKVNVWAALAFRGMMVGLPLMAVSGYRVYGLIVAISYAISFPLAVRLVLLLKLKDAWGKQEPMRSFISGVVAGTIMAVTHVSI